jgi:hypothetical protein
MDILSILSVVSTAVAGGAGTWAATEVVKRAPMIPVNDGEKTKLRATAGLFSALSIALLGFVNGDLQPQDLQSSVQAVLGVGIAWATAHGVHKVIKK